MSLYQNKYRIESTRLKKWDYTSNGHYFITICTKNRKRYFGEIINNKMILSKIGKIAYKYWKEIPNHFPFSQLDNFVIMPNHIHGIIIIDKSNNPVVETDVYGGRDGRPCVSTGKQCVSTIKTNVTNNKFGSQSKNMASIIRGFKIGVTKYKKNNNIPFEWQPRFYDHVIRNKHDLNRIQKYIQNNPHKWKDDGFYTMK